MLYPSQQHTADELSAKLSSSPDTAILLKGLPGQGKSTIVNEVSSKRGVIESPLYMAEHAEAEDLPLFIVSEGRDDREIIQAMTDYRSKIASVILIERLNGTRAVDLTSKGIQVAELSLTPLLGEEIDNMINSMHPECRDEERALIQKYSLGIPLLVEKMIQSRPVDKRVAELILTGYISSISLRDLPSSHEYLSWKKLVDDFFQEHFQVQIPSGVLSEDMYKSMWEVGNPSVCIAKSNAEHSVPIAPETVPLYEDWLTLQRNDKFAPNWVSVFVPDTGDTIDDLLHELDINDHHHCSNNRMKEFGASGRKVSFYYHKNAEFEWDRGGIDGGEGQGMCAELLDLYLQHGELGTCQYRDQSHLGDSKASVEIAEGNHPFMILSYDHEGLYRNPVAVGLCTETYLQGKGIPYHVRYGKGDIHQYNPETQSMTTLMTPEEFNKPHDGA
jgi:hypothetical protein